jgi:membrane carboxypeptidase/penicillin-binding protein
MKDSTAYLITDMLKITAKSGTAKRLKNLPYDIASKTGTVGIPNSKNNLAAINVSYTSNHTIACLISGKNMPENINGGTYPTIITKDICDKLYRKNKPSNFKKPNSEKSKTISKTDYVLGKISLTDSPSDSITELFSNTNLPKQSNDFSSTKLEVFNFENQPPILCFFTSPNLTYQIIRKENDKEVLLATIENLNDSKITKFEDKTAKNSQIYEYFVKICEKSSNLTHQTNSVKLKTFN